MDKEGCEEAAEVASMHVYINLCNCRIHGLQELFFRAFGPRGCKCALHCFEFALVLKQSHKKEVVSCRVDPNVPLLCLAC